MPTLLFDSVITSAVPLLNLSELSAVALYIVCAPLVVTNEKLAFVALFVDTTLI